MNTGKAMHGSPRHIRLAWLFALLISSLAHGQGQERTPAELDDRIRGSVTWEETCLPLVNHPLTLEGGGIEPVHGRTDQQGRFEFSRVPIESGFLLVKVEHANGMRLIKSAERVPHGVAELSFVARKVATLPFRGQALHRRTGQPIPDLRLKIWEALGPAEELTTDATGRFETKAEFAARRLHVYPWDNHLYRNSGASPHTTVVWSHEQAEDFVEVRLEVGRRVELDFQLPTGMQHSDFRVDVRRAGESPAHWTSPITRAMLNAGTYPWFLENPISRVGTGESLFLLSTQDSRAWRAELPSRTQGPLSLTPLSTGSISGKVLESQANPSSTNSEDHRENLSPHSREGLKLHFREVREDAHEPRSFSRWVPIEKDFEIPWVESGLWSYRTDSKYFAAVEGQILVADGVPSDLTIQLGAPLPIGVLRIRVIDEEGDFPEWKGFADAPELSAQVDSIDGPFTYQVETTAFCGVGIHAWFQRTKHEGTWVVEAVLHDLPEGRYRIRMDAGRRVLDIHTQTLATGEVATFRALPRATRGYGIRFPNQQLDDGRYSYVLVSTSRSEDFPFQERPTESGVHTYRLPPEGDLAWCLIPIGGYQRVYGDRNDFRYVDGAYWADVELIPGYSIRLNALLDDGQPAKGVRFQFMGKEFETGADGRVLLQSKETEPEGVITVSGYRMRVGDVDDKGRFRGGLADLRVVLAPLD